MVGTTHDIFTPTTKRHACPVCHRAGCLLADEQGTVAAVCRHVESGKPIGKLGCLHLVVDRGPVWSKSRQRVLKAARMLGEDSAK
jgi:hypothetical protein